jgi:hypothetical protein
MAVAINRLDARKILLTNKLYHFSRPGMASGAAHFSFGCARLRSKQLG